MAKLKPVVAGQGMPDPSLDPIVKTAIVAFGLLFFLGGVGWAYWGTDIFLAAIMAGLSYCGF